MSFLKIFSRSELDIGSWAPEFKLLDQNKEMHILKGYIGTWLVLYFYPKDDTPVCTQEACAFRDDISKLRNMGVKVLGVSVDDIDSHHKFAEKYKLQFPLLADTDGKVANKYGSLTKIGPLKIAKRHTFIIDPDTVIAKIYRKVKSSSHSEDVIEDLKKLQKEYK